MTGSICNEQKPRRVSTTGSYRARLDPGKLDMTTVVGFLNEQ